MSSALSSALALAAIGLAMVALVLATIANRRWSVRGRSARPEQPVAHPVATEHHAAEHVVAEQPATELVTLRAELDRLRSDLDALADAANGPRPDPTALRNVALVRYDAFADVGGRLSYSVALLDDTGSGLVLTTLAGKSDVRTYVRAISAGAPDDNLTAEEQQAIDAAVGSGQ